MARAASPFTANRQEWDVVGTLLAALISIADGLFLASFVNSSSYFVLSAELIAVDRASARDVIFPAFSVFVGL